MPVAVTEEQLSLQASIRDWAQRADPLGVVQHGSPAQQQRFAGPTLRGGAVADGAAAARVHEFLLTRCLSIAGGTTQILLSMVAERGLGLPREETR